MPNLIIYPSGPLRGETTVPGDKSITHRAIILASLAEGETRIRGWVPAEVCLATLRCMRALGAEIEEVPAGAEDDVAEHPERRAMARSRRGEAAADDRHPSTALRSAQDPRDSVLRADANAAAGATADEKPHWTRAFRRSFSSREQPADPKGGLHTASSSGRRAAIFNTELLIHGRGLHGLQEPDDVLHCAGSGTTIRLLAGLLAGQPFTSVLTGTEPLRRRPMGRVAEPLRLMGATVLGRDGGRLPPLTIHGGNLRGIDYRLPVASAQVKSALLLAGLYAAGETIVHEPGPSRDHTERMLAEFGVEVRIAVEGTGARVQLAGGQKLIGGRTLTIPGDFSSAAFPLVAAAIVPGSEVRLIGVGVNPTRTGLYDLLAAMGAELGVGDMATGGHGDGEPIADITIRHSSLRATEVAGDLIVRTIDEFPIFAVAATQAEGVTVVREAAELRVKESDRIAAVTAELRKMGADITELEDGMIVRGPTRLHGAVVECHRDHRLAMALAVAGLVADGETVVRGAEAIADSFPGFVETMQELGADMRWGE